MTPMNAGPHVESQLIKWAAARSGRKEAEIQKKYPRYADWLAGKALPTFKQLEDFAHFTFTPLGYLFLSEPPVIDLPVPDFRTVSDEQIKDPSPHLLDTIQHAEVRQDWLRSYLIEQGESKLTFVGKYTIQDDPQDVADAIGRHVGLTQGWARAHETWEKTLKDLVFRIEAMGILVMTSGIVETSTHRGLDVQEFRGFVLCDAYAPLIFVNGADSKSAQMFTLVHELVHIWIGSGGLFDEAALLGSENATEIFCNEVAARVLLPQAELEAIWAEISKYPDRFERISRIFKISPLVAARRALTLALISEQDFFSFYREDRKRWLKLKQKAKKGGGDFYSNAATRLGKRFATAVFGAAKSGRLPYLEAYRLTGASGATYDKLAEKIGVAS